MTERNTNLLSNATKAFTAASLKDIKKVKLLNRRDKKYLAHSAQIPTILEKLKENYLIIEDNDQRLFDYHSLYFDTKDFMLYHQHHNKKKNRFKIRQREYVDANLSYFELKYKNNKSKTFKTRKKIPEIHENFNELEKDLIENISPINASSYEPKINIDYKRLTLVNKNHKDRITIDFQLKAYNNKNEKLFKNLSIIEYKYDSSTMNRDFLDLMKENRIYESSMSKYCVGIANIYKHLVKQNNFKSLLYKIKKVSSLPLADSLAIAR